MGSVMKGKITFLLSVFMGSVLALEAGLVLMCFGPYNVTYKKRKRKSVCTL